MAALPRVVQTIAVIALWAYTPSPLLAAELPSRIYTTQDGLPRDDVHRIRRDSRGYLWFGTAEGLSIFDGYQFTNYTVNDGLPNRVVQDILETQSGEYWIATYGGLCRFEPRGAPQHRFTTYRLNTGTLGARVNVLIERRDHSIWFGTEGGVWRLQRSGPNVSAERIQLPFLQGDAQRILSLAEDREGNLWAASGGGLYAIWRDGRVTRFTDGDPVHELTLDVLEDHQGRIWTATPRGICRIAPHPANVRNFVERVYPMRHQPTALFESSDGKLWVSSRKLFAFTPDAPGGRDVFQAVATSLGTDFLGPLAEDADHNLWAAGSGVLKVTRHGFATFSTADGLDIVRPYALVQDHAGRICALTDGRTGMTLNEFDGHRFTSVPLSPPPGSRWAWGDAQITFQDHAGDWWIPSARGLLRFAQPARLADLAQARPKNIYSATAGLPPSYSTKQGVPESVVLRLFEDSRGDVWIGLFKGLARWQRSSDRFQAYSVADGLQYVSDQPPVLGTPQSLAEDRAGQIWVGFHPFGLARYRNGRFDFYTKTDGLPEGQISGLYSDHAGRLWIASSQGGAARIDDVTAPRPSFRAYTIAQGLSSDQIITIVEDTAGRIYLGGGHGVDRLTPESGHVRHFTTADGIPPVRVQYSLRDRTGALWFGSGLGLSRYVPEPDRPSEPQPPVIRLLQIAGRPSSVSPLGESAIAGIRLGPAQNNVRIEFASLHFASGEVLRYQYRLEGADVSWIPPTDQRTVNYSNLSPGRYRFLVKAVNGEGLSSAKSATIDFVILPPVWRQAWFIMLVACAIGAVLYSAHRYRIGQVLRLERIRTRLASDLHDDIGSGLAEIAILTDVAELQPVSATGDLMRRAGDRARELRDSMSDIVWSVDPHHGNLADLIHRIRQTVFSLMESNGKEVLFEALGEDAEGTLAPDGARNLLMIVKEALTNVSKHSGASQVSVRLHARNRRLILEVRDNGRGFDPAAGHTGMGLRNLRRRAAESRGELSVTSKPGEGALITLSLPLS